MIKHRMTLLALAIGSLAMLAQAAEPAVSALNGKVSVQGGDVNGTNARSIDGVLSAPLGQSFGAQLDLSSGHFLNDSYRGYGGHLFWRDPSVGLVGVTSAHQRLGNVSTRRNGLEGEAYVGRFTLGMRAGQQTSESKTGGFVGAGMRWYPSDNLAVNLGMDDAPGLRTVGAGLEWQPTSFGLPGLSVFLRGNAANNDNHSATVGVRYYFGAPKSLMQRHRTDDPESIVQPGGDVIPTPVPVSAPAAQPITCTPPQFLVNGACVET